MIVSVVLSFRNGWGSLHAVSNPAAGKMMEALGIKASYMPAFGIIMLAVGVLMLFPKTFLLGNLLSAVSIVVIMALALHHGNYKIALIEIPFLILPLLLVWLTYPFLKN